MREIRVHLKVDHPNIVKAFSSSITEKYAYIFMEYCNENL